MKKKKILIVSYSKESFGYIVPASVLGKKLQNEGHEVILCCSEESKEIPTSFGLTHVSISEKESIKTWDSIKTKEDYYNMHKFSDVGLANVDYLRSCYNEESTLIDTFKPNLVISVFRFTACIAAKEKNVPSMFLLNMNIPLFFPDLMFFINESIEEMFTNRELSNHMLGDCLLVPDFQTMVDESLINQKLKQLLHSNGRNIKYITPLLREEVREMKSKAEAKKELGFDSNTPLVYITFGGSNNTKVALDAIIPNLTGGYHYYIVTGSNLDPEIYSEIVEKYKSQNMKVTVEQYTNDSMKIMRAADLALIHGGHSTTMEALFCATPVIGFPNTNEQHQNLQRAVMNETGIILSFEDIRTAFDTHINNVYNSTIMRKNANELSEKLIESMNDNTLQSLIDVY